MDYPRDDPWDDPQGKHFKINRFKKFIFTALSLSSKRAGVEALADLGAGDLGLVVSLFTS